MSPCLSSRSQTSQGVQPKRFKTLPELVLLYLQPSQGLVTTLLYAVDREETAVTDDRDYSGNKHTLPTKQPSISVFPLRQTLTHFLRPVDGEDEKPPLPPRSASTSTPPGPETPTERYKVCVMDHLVPAHNHEASLNTNSRQNVSADHFVQTLPCFQHTDMNHEKYTFLPTFYFLISEGNVLISAISFQIQFMSRHTLILILTLHTCPPLSSYKRYTTSC